MREFDKNNKNIEFYKKLEKATNFIKRVKKDSLTGM